MTYLTEEERAARKQLAQQKYKNKEEVKIRKRFNDCNSRRRRLGLSVFTFNEWHEWYKTNHYNEDLSFLNEKFPLSQKLLSIEECNRRTFIMQKLQRVLKHLGLSTKILMNYKIGHYTMQQLKTFLEMYQNKEWKNNERK